jgi:oxygen-independent coproporphyrinogen-3 oxidase
VCASLSLYIHIPFCAPNNRGRCDYCDFYSTADENLQNNYIDAFIGAVIVDVEYQIKYFNVSEIPTVYIGGGTPSVLGRCIGVLLEAFKKISGFDPVEITVEANPESSTEEFLCACREGGVNRISLGVQTFNESSREAVNRIGNVKMLDERLALCSRFFPGSLSVDLITGLPYQNERIVLEDVKRLLDFDPVHVSLYSLSVESGTPLAHKLENKKISLPDRDKADALWLTARDALIEAGFHHYEVSNFARNGKKCLHNIRYWLMKGWLGAGPSASGTIVDENEGIAKRFTYAPDIIAYINSPFIETAICEELNKAALMRESLLMGYRYCEGPDAEIFKRRFGCSVEECIPKTLSRWEGRDKMLFLNSFLCEAFNELDLIFPI